MKKIKLALLAVAGLSMSITGYGGTENIKSEQSNQMIPAIKLVTISENHSTFIKGAIPTLEKIPTQKFWFSHSTEDWEKNVHPAPRKQYVVTLKGTLKFKVSDGSTFIISPGTVLLAEDIQGEGHSWEMIDGDEWVRMYIPIIDDNDYFVAEK